MASLGKCRREATDELPQISLIHFNMEKEIQTSVQTIDYEGRKHVLFDLPFYGSVVKVFFVEREYQNGNFAVEVMNLVLEDEDGNKLDEPMVELWSVATVNLGLPLLPGYAYGDTNNNSWLLPFVKKHKLASSTGMSAMSGFCTYPLLCWKPKNFYLKK